MLSRFSDVNVVVVGGSHETGFLDSLFRRAGVRHVHQLSDHELLEQFHRLEPDLVLLDLQTPRLDALGLLDKLVRRAAGTYLPVLVITSATNPGLAHRALSAGARDYVTRPLNAIEVLLRAGNLLETRGLYQQLRRVNTSLAAEIDRDRRTAHDDPEVRQHKSDEVLAALAAQSFDMVFQPVVEVPARTVLGFEALARFGMEPQRRPDEWFTDAADVGLGYALELSAVSRALQELPRLPPGGFLSVNVSNETLMHPNLLSMACPDVAPRLVLELTEHLPVEDYGPLREALTLLRERGVRLAVDDTGAGFASLRHLVALSPEIIKLDITLVRGVDEDAARRALVTAMVAFAADTGAHLLAEGVESAAELATLESLGVRWAQGYFFGEPRPLAGPEPHLAAG